MSSEPRSKNYPHVYQRSLDAVKDTPGEPVLWQVMRALALDPLEAQDAKDEQQWPSSDFADFCAHPDKNARQAALETIATWVRRQPMKNFKNTVAFLAVYNRRILMWSLLEVPRPWAMSNIFTEETRSKIDDSIRFVRSWVASEEVDSDTMRMIRRAGSYFERELDGLLGAAEPIDLARMWCVDSMDVFTSLVDNRRNPYEFVDRASRANSEIRRLSRSYNSTLDGVIAMENLMRDQIINRILTYPYNW